MLNKDNHQCRFRLLLRQKMEDREESKRHFHQALCPLPLPWRFSENHRNSSLGRKKEKTSLRHVFLFRYKRRKFSLKNPTPPRGDC